MSKLTNGQKSVEAFQTWMATMTDDDYKQIVWRGKLNREEVAKGCGIAKAALRQNPKVAEMLSDLEQGLRQRGILPELSEEATLQMGKPIQYDQDATRRAQDAKRASKLERDNIALKAKIKALESQLERFKELSEVMSEMGILPR